MRTQDIGRSSRSTTTGIATVPTFPDLLTNQKSRSSRSTTTGIATLADVLLILLMTLSRSSRSTTTGIATYNVDANKYEVFGFVEAVGPLQQGLRRCFPRLYFLYHWVEAVGPLQQGLRLI